MNLRSICFGLCLLLTGTVALAEDAWVNLFDGKTLDGWTRRGGTANYEVVDGTIKGTTTEGSPNTFLCTDKLYTDFELQFQVKVHDNLNSGCQIRSQEQSHPKRGKVVAGPQVEIESGPAEAGYIYGEATGGGWLTPEKRRKPHDHMKNGDWNQFRIVAKGNRIQTWINGEKIEELDLIEDLKLNDKLDGEEFVKQYREGFIGLQVHGIKAGTGPYWVQWKEIKLKEL